MSKRRIIAFACCYLLVVAVCVIFGFEFTMTRFEQGGEPAYVERGASLGASLLLAPADQIWAFIGRDRFGPGGQWLLLIGNALLWGLAVEIAFTAIRDRFRTPR